MTSRITTVAQYLASLPPDRRAAVEALRKVINANIDPQFEEGLQYGMLAWYLPHSRYPSGYHCDPKQPLPFASIGSGKSHISLHMFCIYGHESEQETFQREWRAAGKKLDMGAACVRVKKLEDVPLDVLGRAFARMTAAKFVAHYEAKVRTPQRSTKGASAKKVAAKTATAKTVATKTVATKKTAAKKVAAKAGGAKKSTAKSAGSAAASSRKTATKSAAKKTTKKTAKARR